MVRAQVRGMHELSGTTEFVGVLVFQICNFPCPGIFFVRKVIQAGISEVMFFRKYLVHAVDTEAFNVIRRPIIG